MLRDDLVDDRQPEAHPGDLRREVGKEELLLVLGADARAGVRDDDARVPGLGQVHGLDHDLSHGADRLDRVVDEVEDRALDVVGVHLEEGQVPHVPCRERDARVRLAVERDHGVDERADVGRPRRQDGHPREARELVDETLEAVHLLDDRLRALGDELQLLAGAPSQPAPEALGRQLDGGERVLDLVGDALGDLPPGRDTLGLQELGEVVEDDDRARILAIRPAERGRRGEERERRAAQAELELLLDRGALGPGGALDERHHLPEGGPDEHLLEELTDRARLGEAEHPRRGAVDGREAAERVEGDHAGRDGLEHGLGVAAAILELRVLVGEIEVGFFEPLLRLAEVVGHAVERLDQDADLVVGPRLHLVGEVARGDLTRRLGELGDRAGDPAREVETEPREREDDDQRHQQEQEDVDALDRRLQELELLVLLKRLRDAAHARLEPVRHVHGDDDRADDLLLGPGARGPDRHRRLDDVAGGDLTHGGNLLAGQAALQLVLVDVLGRQVGEQRIPYVHELLSLRAEHRHRADPETFLLLDEEGAQALASVRGEEPVAVDHTPEVSAVAERRPLEVAVVRLRHGQRLVERALHLGLEPPLDRLVDEVRRDHEDQDRRRQRERQEREDQLRLELRPDHVLPALEPELDEVAEEQHDEQQQDDQVQVE